MTVGITRRFEGKAFAPPNPPAAWYFYALSPGGVTTNSALGNGTLRIAPWVVARGLNIDRIGADVATVGEAGSRFRIGVYADNGSCYPGALLLDAGQINGDSATVQAITVSLALSPGLYWIGGVVQSAATTQPTMRTTQNWTPPVVLSSGTGLPPTTAQLGYQQSSVSGALPATFTATPAVTSSMPRIFVRAA